MLLQDLDALDEGHRRSGVSQLTMEDCTSDVDLQEPGWILTPLLDLEHYRILQFDRLERTRPGVLMLPGDPGFRFSQADVEKQLEDPLENICIDVTGGENGFRSNFLILSRVKTQF